MADLQTPSLAGLPVVLRYPTAGSAYGGAADDGPEPVVYPPIAGLMRQSIERGTYDGRRREWDVRAYRWNGSAWKRIRMPAVTQATYTAVVNGGMSECTVSLAEPFRGPIGIQDGDRISVYTRLNATQAWAEQWRGYVREAGGETGRPDTGQVQAFGAIEWMSRIYVRRRYAMPSADLADLFARVLDDYVDPARAALGLPAFTRDLRAVGETVNTRDFDSPLSTLFTNMANSVPGVSWGVELDPAGNERVYLRPRSDAVMYTVAIGRDAAAAGWSENTSDLVNAIRLIGAEPEHPNLVQNGSFEAPTGDAVNLIPNGGFEQGLGEHAAMFWENVTGEPSKKVSGQQNIDAATGSNYYLFDNYKSGTECVRSAPTPTLTPGIYEFRVKLASESATDPAEPEIWVSVFDVNDLELTKVYMCGGGSGRDWTPASQAWIPYALAWELDIPGMAYARVYIRTPDAARGRGLCVDDVVLFNRSGIYQENWQVISATGTDRALIEWDASAGGPAEGDYYTRMDVATGTGSVRLRQVAGWGWHENQQRRMQVSIRAAGAGATVPVNLDLVKVNGAGGETGVTYLADVPTDGAWHDFYVDAIGASDTQSGIAQISIGSGITAVIDVDAVYVHDGFQTFPWVSGDPNRTWRIDTDHPEVQAAAAIGDDVKGSIARYGRRETWVSAPNVKTDADAIKWAINYFSQNAIPRIPGPITVTDRMRPFRPDGKIRLTNIPGVSGLAPLYAVRCVHTFNASGWTCQIERDMERPNMVGLIRGLGDTAVTLFKSAAAGIQAAQTSAQRG